MQDHVIEEDRHVPPSQIVSVNDRGGGGQGIVGKMVFGLLIAAVLVVGAVYGVNRYRAAQAEENAKKAKMQQADKRGASQAGRRVFSATAPTPPDAPRAGPAPQPKNPAMRCGDGSPGQVLTDADGKAMSTSDGQQLRVCGNGQLLWTSATPAMPAPAQPAAAAVPSAADTAPRHSRYAGDVLVPAKDGPTRARIDKAGYPAPGPTAVEQLARLASTAAATDAPQIQTPPERTAAQRSPADSSTPSPVRAAMLGDRDMILPQDRSIDCNLSMRVVSEVSGRAVCVLSSPVFGDSGRVVLLEAGTVASGVYTPPAAQGQRRIPILWTRLKTPKGVVINLNSPAADALGTAGLAGEVDNRWPERIGAAFLLSVVQDAIGYQTARAASDNGNAATGIAVFQHSTDTGNRMAEKVLDSTINIKPTIYMQPGDRATITVARDLDFGSVYDLRRK